MTKYWSYKAAFGFTNQRFFNTKIQSQLYLDLMGSRFIIRGFVEQSLLHYQVKAFGGSKKINQPKITKSDIGKNLSTEQETRHAKSQRLNPGHKRE